MLIIRAEQMEAFQADVDARFADRMKAHVTHEHPRHVELLGDAGVTALIQRAIADKARLGITGDRAVVTLIALRVEFGERFERAPERAWAERMLADKTLPGDVKVSAIRARFDAMTGGRRLVPA